LRGWIVYPGEQRFRVGERVEAVPLSDLAVSGNLFREGVH